MFCSFQKHALKTAAESLRGKKEVGVSRWDQSKLKIAQHHIEYVTLHEAYQVNKKPHFSWIVYSLGLKNLKRASYKCLKRAWTFTSLGCEASRAWSFLSSTSNFLEKWHFQRNFVLFESSPYSVFRKEFFKKIEPSLASIFP